jgi:hypothetical protein
MENETRYDLNAAVNNWRQELAAQAGLTAENRRELETHLRDAIAGFQQRGLSDDESFWLARRRVGQAQQLGEEFVKADPAAVWRERVFWMVLACLGISLWEASSLYFYFLTVCPLFGDFSWSGNHSLSEQFIFHNEYFRSLFFWLPIFGCALILAKGWAGFTYPRMLVFFRSRFRVAWLAFSAVLINCGMLILFYWPKNAHAPNAHMHWDVWWADFSYELFWRTIWPFLLITLLVWLMPAQNRKTLKHA